MSEHTYTIPFNLNELLNTAEYANASHLKIKKSQYHSELNLYTIKYLKNKLTTNNIDSLGLMRSVIVKGDKIIGFSPPKSHKFEDLCIPNSIIESFKFEEYVEGTMINCFYLPEKNHWEISTRSCITANCTFSSDCNKSFRTMWFEALQTMGAVDMNKLLNKDYCYSFVLQHPENRIVVPFKVPNIVLIAIYRIEKDVITKQNLNSNEFAELKKHFSIPTPITPYSTWDENKKVFSHMEDMKVGVVITHKKTGQRTKIRNKNYENIRRIIGNSKKLQFQYYSLRKLKKVKDFLNYYPEYNDTFSLMQIQLHKWTTELYQNYIKCFIKKEGTLKDYAFPFRIHMYNLHQIYLKNLREKKQSINKRIVINHVNNLDPAALMYLINFKDSHMVCGVTN